LLNRKLIGNMLTLGVLVTPVENPAAVVAALDQLALAPGFGALDAHWIRLSVFTFRKIGTA
jgi:hypothetical protein